MKAIGGIIIGAAVLLVACGGDDKSPSKLVAATPATPTTAAATQPAKAQTTAPTTAPSPTATPVPGKLEVSEQAFFQYKDTSGSAITPWVAIIKNPSTTMFAGSTKVSALFYDAGGVLLKTQSATLNAAWPGQTVAVGEDYANVPGVPVKLEIRMEGTKFEKPATGDAFGVADVSFVTERFGSKVSGKVTSPFQTDLKDLRVTCVVDKAGQVVGIGTTFLDLLPGGATAIAQCSIDSRHPTAGATGARMFVGVSNLTLLQVTPTAGR